MLKDVAYRDATNRKIPDTFYRVSLKAFIRNKDGHVLVCKEGSQTFWSLPGGGWDHGETEEVALKRELHEELGYTGNISYHPIATQVFYLPSHDAQLLWVVYDVTVDHDITTLGEHGTDVAYVDPEEFKDSEYGTYEQAQAAIYEINKTYTTTL